MKHKIVLYARKFRVYHRRIGYLFLIFFLIISVSGFLLALKDVLHLKPEIVNINSPKDSNWISLKEIDSISKDYIYNKFELDTVIDRIDVRPTKGVAKVLFSNHFTELQIDVSSGKILSVSSRVDTIIEKIHDGSIIDYFITHSNISKIIYSSLISIGLIFMSISDFFLWYFPKRLKSRKQ